VRVGGGLDGQPCNHVHWAICSLSQQARAGLLSLLDDPGSAVCRAHEARRLKPLHASTKTGPNWRPSAVHGPASKFDLQLCAVTCSHLPGKLAPHLLSPTRRRRLREDERASLSPLGRFRSPARPDGANLSNRGSPSSKVTCGDGCSGCSPFRAMPRRSQRQFDCPGGRAMSFTRSAVAQ
jgi:hypothetical protein